MSAALPYCAAQRVLTEQGTSVGTGWAESHHGSVCWHCPSCVVRTDTPSPLPCCLQATKVSITPGGKLRTQLQTLTTYKHPYQLHIHTHHTITMYIHTNTHAYHTITMYTLTHTLTPYKHTYQLHTFHNHIQTHTLANTNLTTHTCVLHTHTTHKQTQQTKETNGALDSPTFTKGMPSKGTYCDFHISRVEGLAGLGDCRVPQKLLVCCLW